MHRLPGVRSGLPRPGDLSGQWSAREVADVHREEQEAFREQVNPAVTALPTRGQAVSLLHEWVANPNLRKHCRAVEAAMRAYAGRYGGDAQRWGLAWLIQHFAWDR